MKVLASIAEAMWAPWEDAAVMTDDAGRVISCNEVFEKLSGRSRRELQQIPATNLVPQTSMRIYQEMWHRLNLCEPWKGVLVDQHGGRMTWWTYDEIWPIDYGQRTIGYWARIRAGAPGERHWDPRQPDDALALTPVFQPLVEVESGEIWGYEALIRPQLGGVDLSPDALFAWAGSSGAVARVDQWCLECTAVALKDAQMPDGRWISLNVRADTLDEPTWLNEFLDRFPVSRERVILEVCEQDGRPKNIPSWHALKQAYPGVMWALDDWGAGRNDIDRLVNMAPDWVKIDRAWLLLASGDHDARTLLAECAWAERSGRHVIMEGVETAEEVQLCKNVGIARGQGHFWGRPSRLMKEGAVRGSIGMD